MDPITTNPKIVRAYLFQGNIVHVKRDQRLITSEEVLFDKREEGHLKRALAMTGTKGFDVILENRAELNLGTALAALSYNGRVVVVGSRGSVEINPKNLIGTEGTVTGVRMTGLTVGDMKAYSAAIVAGMEEGWIRPVVGKEYHIEDVQKAHEDIMKEHGAHGKIVITM